VFTFRRPKVRLEVPRLKPRGEAVQLPRVNLAELTPALLPYLGQAAYIQLSLFESLSRIVTQAPTVAHKESLGPAAGQALDKHERLVAEIRRHVADPAVIMQPFAAAIDDYREVVAGATWHEALTSLYVSAGILDDFFIHLAAGLENGSGPRMVQILDAESGRQAIATIVAEGIALLADRIVMAHAKDRAPDGDFATAGKGVLDFDHYLACLAHAKFDGPLVTHGLAAIEAAEVSQFLTRKIAGLPA
jgi:hypothetical protein